MEIASGVNLSGNGASRRAVKRQRPFPSQLLERDVSPIRREKIPRHDDPAFTSRRNTISLLLPLLLLPSVRNSRHFSQHFQLERSARFQSLFRTNLFLNTKINENYIANFYHKFHHILHLPFSTQQFSIRIRNESVSCRYSPFHRGNVSNKRRKVVVPYKR